jgi:hypothetical protein
MGDLEINITSVGPITKTNRDELKALRDKMDHANYNETVGYLLELAEASAEAA